MVKRIILILLFIFVLSANIFITAQNLVPLRRSDGNSNLVYRNTNIEVLIPDSYSLDVDFRAVWISHLVADIPSYTGVNQYKTEINRVLDTMEYFNLNAMIFHIRTHNNALYRSDLNPVASWYQNVNFNNFDPLEYIIAESHKRGIEFHAWLNPYRLTTTFTGTVEQFAANQPSYNIASRADLLLKSTGTHSSNTIIFNPGEPEVRAFLEDTVIEILERYNVDAIHFDDYFYVPSVDDSATRAKYNTNNLSIANYRRLQVDLLIEQLSTSIRNFNEQTGRVVQFGISPTGIYQNGSHVPLENYIYNDNGDLIYPVWSNTAGFTHYGDYLYADTKKWVDKEWIDYILPQSYWAFEQPVAGYADIMDWWSMVVKNKNVNLYSGMGVYMINESNSYSWKTNNEALNQVLYGNKHQEIKGHSVYSYKHLRNGFAHTSGLFFENLSRVKNNAWYSKAILPEIRTYDPIILDRVENLNLNVVNNGYNISFTAVNNAKSYVIYRSTEPLKYSPNEVVTILGTSDSSNISYTDVVSSGNYYYGVKVLSKTNSLSEAISTATFADNYTVTFKDYNGDILKIETVNIYDNATAPIVPERIGYTFVGWDQDFNNVSSDLVITAVYNINQFTVTFYNEDVLYHQAKVDYGKSVSLPVNPTKSPTKEFSYEFIGWDQDLFNITEDITVNALYLETINTYTVRFYNEGLLIEEFVVSYGESIALDNTPAKPATKEFTFTFIGWDQDISYISEDLIVNALYLETINTYRVRFYNEGLLFEEVVVNYGESIVVDTTPTKPATIEYTFTFLGWDQDVSYISEDLIVNALYLESINTFTVRFYNEGLLFEEVVVNYGESIVLDTIPTKPSTKEYTFTFLEWDQDLTNITEDITVNSFYLETINFYTIIFFNGNKIVYSMSVMYGLYIIEPDIFEQRNDFIGWFLDDHLYNFNTLVSEDVDLYAKWEVSNKGCNTSFNFNVFIQVLGLSFIMIIKRRKFF